MAILCFISSEIAKVKLGIGILLLRIMCNMVIHIIHIIKGTHRVRDLRAAHGHTGLKSGEKMDEELALDHADLKDSAHPSIMVLREAEVRDLEKDIMNLEILTRTAPSKTLVQLLNELVPSFTPASSHAKGTGDA